MAKKKHVVPLEVRGGQETGEKDISKTPAPNLTELQDVEGGRGPKIYGEIGGFLLHPENKFQASSLSEIQKKFGCKAALCKDLADLGIKDVDSLAFEIEEGAISKARSARCAINIYRGKKKVREYGAGEKRERLVSNVAMRYLVKERPVEAQKLYEKVEGYGIFPKAIHAEERKSFSDTDMMVVERYVRRGSGFTDQADLITADQFSLAGKELGRHLSNLEANGLVWDPKYWQTHMRVLVDSKDPSNLRIVLLDPKNLIELPENDGERNELVIRNLAIYAGACRGLSHNYGADLWRGVSEQYKAYVGVPIDGDRSTAQPVLARIRSRHQYQVSETESRLTLEYGNTFAQRKFTRFFKQVRGIQRTARHPTNPSQQQREVYTEILSQRLNELGVTGVGEAVTFLVKQVSADVAEYKQAREPGLDELKVHFQIGIRDVGGQDTASIRVLSPEPEKKKISEYAVAKADKVSLLKAASHAGVGEYFLKTTSRGDGILHLRSYALDQYLDHRPNVCAEIGDGLAKLFVRSINKGYVLAEDIGKTCGFYVEDPVISHVRSNSYIKSDREHTRSTESVGKTLLNIIDYFKSMENGHVAYKAFRNSLFHETPGKKTDKAVMSAVVLVEESLQRDPENRIWFEKSRAATWSHPLLDGIHSDIIEKSSMRTPELQYSEKTRGLVEKLEPQIKMALDRFFEQSHVEVPWTAAPYVKIAVPYAGETNKTTANINYEAFHDAVLPLVAGEKKDLDDYALVVDPHLKTREFASRFYSWSGKQLVIPVKGGVPGGIRVIESGKAQSETGYIECPGLMGFVRQENPGNGVDYSIHWPENNFTGQDAEEVSLLAGSGRAGKKRRKTYGESRASDGRTREHKALLELAARSQLDGAWNDSLASAIANYYDCGKIIESCIRHIAGVEDFDDRYALVVGVNVGGQRHAGLPEILDPSSDRLPEDGHMPILLENPQIGGGKSRGFYANLKPHAEKLLTAMDHIHDVRMLEESRGRRLSINEYRKLLSGQPQVEVEGENLSEMLRGVYRKHNLNRYVLLLEMNREGEGNSRLILKTSDLRNDLAMSSVCQIMDIKASVIWPATRQWGLESYVEGSTPMEMPERPNINPGNFARQVGYIGGSVGCFPIHPHGKNMILDSEGNATLIDLEVESAGLRQQSMRLYPDCGYLLGYGTVPTLTYLRDWNPPENPASTMGVWDDFCKGVHKAHERFIREEEAVRRVFESQPVGIDSEQAISRVKLDPEKKLRDTALYLIEEEASNSPKALAKDYAGFWRELPEFYARLAGKYGIREFDLRWGDIIDDTSLGSRRQLQQSIAHQALRGTGEYTLEDWERRIREVQSREETPTVRRQREAKAKGEVIREGRRYDKEGRFLGYADGRD